MRKRWFKLGVIMAALAMVAAACGDDGSGETVDVSVQLQWFAQSQFAGG